MGLTTALSNALSGLYVTQAGMDIVSQNVSNAQTPGYTRKIQNNSMVASDGQVRGVQAGDISRAVDTVLQRNLRSETTTSGYLSIQDTYLSRLDSILGQPGSANAIDTLFNNFTTALQGLVTSPESDIAQTQAVSEAQLLAQRLNAVSNDVIELRSQTERAITDAVDQVNKLLGQIESINRQVISQTSVGGIGLANAMDARDRALQDLASYMDINVTNGDQNAITIATTNGTVLFDGTAVELQFDGRDTLPPQAVWSADASERDVGTITVQGSGGTTFDLIAGNAIQNGKLASLIQLRDERFVEAQAQLDELASMLALAISNKTTEGTAATSGAAAGFDLDLATMESGNTFSVEIVDGGTTRNYTFVKTTDAASAASVSFGPTNKGDYTVGIDFSGGLSSVVTQVAAALGSNFTVSNPSGSTLRILDDGAGGNSDVNSAETWITQDGLTDGDAEFSLFIDSSGGTALFTGAPENGGQKVGFAQRIAINSSIVDDPSKLVIYSTSPLTGAGDPTRPQAILDAIQNSSGKFSPSAGIGSTSSPFEGSLAGYLQRIISTQSGAAENAARLHDSQEIVLTNLQSRNDETSGVDVDTEMANLVVLQQMYSANARVVSAINQMYETLLRM